MATQQHQIHLLINCTQSNVHTLFKQNVNIITHIFHKLDIGQHHEVIEDVTSSSISVLLGDKTALE